MKSSLALLLTAACFATIFFAGTVYAQILHVDSVSVDSVWNSDSTWYDGNGIQQKRTSRDCKVSFIPQGEGMARMFIALSLDSGKTWAPSPNPLSVMNNALASTFMTGQKATITIRVIGGDRPGVAFKMTARQAAPVIAGNPKTKILGLTEALTPGANVDAVLNVRLAGASESDGFCTAAKVYWDAFGDGVIDDSTTGVNVFTWTWVTQVPAGVSGQKRGVIVRAIDKNGLSSMPETLSVQFGPDSSDNISLMDFYLQGLLGKVSAVDSLAKAASVLPVMQQAYVDMKFGMFIHFNMSTFDRCCCSDCRSVSGEWGYAASASVVPDKFHPSKLDIGQWARAAKSAGMKYMVLTAKHHDGFCIWPSKWNTHNVKKSSWAGGNRDILREYVDTLTKYGLKVGFYYSIWDKTQGSSIPFIKAQLAELLTNYGPVTGLYFDGWDWVVGYSRVPYDTIRNFIKTLQPNCLIMENNHKYAMKNTEIVTYEVPVDGPPAADNTLPSVACQTIRLDHCWFWHPDEQCNILSAQKIVDELNMNNSRHANYLLDLTPDTLGLIPQCQIDTMAKVGMLRGITP